MKEFSPKRSEFFYIKVSDLQTNRDNKLSELFGEESRISYLGANNKKVDKIYLAKFWKDKMSVNRVLKSKNLILEVFSIDRNTFINSIPDESGINDYVYSKNLELKRKEINYQERESKFLSQYKAISAYKFPRNWFSYLPCPNCGLKPLVWEFDNGRSTACGCGENEYNHFSIKAESIMSYIKRNGGSSLGYISGELLLNWNQWVKTGEVLFEVVGGRW
jgi:hypothetical protein